MTKIRLKRHSETPQATFGLLTGDGFRPIATLELPWRNNERCVSRIPAGEYKLKARRYGFYYNAYKRKPWKPQHEFSIELLDVPGRGDILLHSGNYPRHTKGCILVGQEYDLGANMVRGSYSAYRDLYESLCAFCGADDVLGTLEIVDSGEDEPGRDDAEVL